MARSTRDGHYFPGTDGHTPPMAVIGPMARDADDLALALDLLADRPLPQADGARAGRLAHPAAGRPIPSPPIAAPIADALERDRRGVRGRGRQRSTGAAPSSPISSAQFGQYMQLLMTALSRGVPLDGSAPPPLADLVRPARRPGARGPRLEPRCSHATTR